MKNMLHRDHYGGRLRDHPRVRLGDGRMHVACAYSLYFGNDDFMICVSGLLTRQGVFLLSKEN